MKYLFVSSDKFPPFRVDVSELFANELKKKGHKIHFLLQSEDNCNFSYRTEWEGNVVYVGKSNCGKNILHKIYNNILKFKHDLKIFNLIYMNDYDFILIKDKFIIAFIAAFLVRLKKIKMIYWLSYPFPEANIYKAKKHKNSLSLLYLIRGFVFKFLLYKIIIECSLHCFVQSEQMKKDISRNGVKPELMTAVPMGVNLQEFDKLTIENPYSKDENHPKIVYLGTLIKLRRMDFIIHVMKHVVERIPNAILYLVGDSENPNDLVELKELSKELKIYKSIKFIGFLERKKALGYVYFGDVCVSPFFPTPILNSTSPTKAIEYLALKKPIVANDHPEQKYIIDSSNSGICVPYEVKAFADAIVFLIINYEDAATMGKYGRKFIENYRTYGKIANMVHQKMKEVIKNRS